MLAVTLERASTALSVTSAPSSAMPSDGDVMVNRFPVVPESVALSPQAVSSGAVRARYVAWDRPPRGRYHAPGPVGPASGPHAVGAVRGPALRAPVAGPSPATCALISNLVCGCQSHLRARRGPTGSRWSASAAGLRARPRGRPGGRGTGRESLPRASAAAVAPAVQWCPIPWPTRTARPHDRAESYHACRDALLDRFPAAAASPSVVSGVGTLHRGSGGGRFRGCGPYPHRRPLPASWVGLWRGRRRAPAAAPAGCGAMSGMERDRCVHDGSWRCRGAAGCRGREGREHQDPMIRGAAVSGWVGPCHLPGKGAGTLQPPRGGTSPTVSVASLRRTSAEGAARALAVGVGAALLIGGVVGAGTFARSSPGATAAVSAHTCRPRRIRLRPSTARIGHSAMRQLPDHAGRCVGYCLYKVAGGLPDVTSVDGSLLPRHGRRSAAMLGWPAR